MDKEIKNHMKEILDIINPVRILKVEDWVKVAEILVAESGEFEMDSIVGQNVVGSRAFGLMQRFEQLTQGNWVEEQLEEHDLLTKYSKLNLAEEDGWTLYSAKGTAIYYKKTVWQPALLTKEHFVCEVEKPVHPAKENKNWKHEEKMEYDRQYHAWQRKQSKVWFAGFENEISQKLTSITKGKIRLYCYPDNKIYYYIGDRYMGLMPTIYDFIYEIDRYNRTAAQPITILWTENFVKLWLTVVQFIK